MRTVELFIARPRGDRVATRDHEKTRKAAATLIDANSPGASDAPRFVVARSANTTRAKGRERVRKGARGCVRPRAAGCGGGENRAKKIFFEGAFCGAEIEMTQ